MSARILVIHDQQFRREQMRDALQPMHYVAVGDGIAHAIELLKTAELQILNASPFDLIVSAVHLDSNDNLSVFDLLKWCRGNKQLRAVPFVLVDIEPSATAKYVIDAVRSASNTLGASAFLIIAQFEAAAFLSALEPYISPELRITAEGSRRNNKQSSRRS